MSTHIDTIAAVSTPPGKGGVAIIRISGIDALTVAEKVFKTASGKRITDYQKRTQIYGYITDGDFTVDDGMLTHFPAPNSYTGETVVEISCHGGILVTRRVLECVLASGARYADAGEFTRRAFINGKLTLTEAEAIGTLLEAKSEEQIKLSATASRERLTERIDGIRERLTGLLSSMYARIDYPEEDLGDFTDKELEDSLEEISKDTEQLLSTYKTGRAINEGITAVICGKPNVGKSTLYNMLVGDDAAIVTDIAGTTRDIIERTVPLGRVILRLLDTAGIRDTASDAVERIGIARTREAIRSAGLIIAVFDLSRRADEEDEALIEEIKKTNAAKIAIYNKNDLEICHLFDKTLTKGIFDREITASAIKDCAETHSELAKAVDTLFTDERLVTGNDAIVATARQHAALKRALEGIKLAKEGIRQGIAQDAVSTDAELALGAISEVDGKAVTDAVVSDIFKKFCVGK